MYITNLSKSTACTQLSGDTLNYIQMIPLPHIHGQDTMLRELSTNKLLGQEMVQYPWRKISDQWRPNSRQCKTVGDTKLHFNEIHMNWSLQRPTSPTQQALPCLPLIFLCLSVCFSFFSSLSSSLCLSGSFLYSGAGLWPWSLGWLSLIFRNTVCEYSCLVNEITVVYKELCWTSSSVGVFGDLYPLSVSMSLPFFS